MARCLLTWAIVRTPVPSEDNTCTLQGRGKGNAFLNDLCDADVLIHIVDASGRSDREGVASTDTAGYVWCCLKRDVPFLYD